MTQYRIIFLDGWWLDFAPPQHFHFPTFITTCRSNGMFLSDQIYVRWDLVRCVLPWQGDAPPTMPTPTVPPNAPSTETPQ